MATLYELTGEYLELLDMLSDPDVDPELIADTLEAMDGQLEVKAEGYGVIIKDMEAEAAKFKAEAERMAKKKKTLENNITKLKEHLKASMIVLDKKKIQTEHFSFTVKTNPPTCEIDDDKMLPDEYKIPQPPKTDMKKLLEDLKKLPEGETVEYAHIKRSTSLLIK